MSEDLRTRARGKHIGGVTTQLEQRVSLGKTAAEPLREAVRVVFDGRHSWGSYMVAAGRFGVVQRSLVLYPPGIDRKERRWLRLWRGMTPIAIAVAALVMLLIGEALPLWGSALVSAAAVLLPVGLLAYRVRRSRGRVRCLVALRSPRQYGLAGYTGYAEALRLARRLMAAEEQLRAGEIDQVEYELRWHRAYEALPGLQHPEPGVRL